MKVEVRALPERGFFRAGRFFPHSPTEVEVGKEVLARLEAEPRLSVKRLEGKGKPADDQGKPKGKGKPADEPDGQGEG